MTSPSGKPRLRLTRDERERRIVADAIHFFAETGFGGDTTALARRLNIAQGLLYRYFATKDALIERIFQETFMDAWNPLWEQMLTDPSVGLHERLLRFHKDYARVHLRRERVRLSLFFALHGWDMSPYFTLMIERVYTPIALALKQHVSNGRAAGSAPSELEIEYARTIIIKIQQYGIRKWVYGLKVPEPIGTLIEIDVRAMLEGAHVAMQDKERPQIPHRPRQQKIVLR